MSDNLKKIYTPNDNFEALQPILNTVSERFADDLEETGSGLAGDINGDKVVDLKDLEILAYYWLSDCN